VTGPDDRPLGPDGSQLSQEEWDAVRRLRDRPPRETPAAAGESAAPAGAVGGTGPAEPATARQVPADPATAREVPAEAVARPEPRVTRRPASPAPGALVSLVALVVVAVAMAALGAVVAARLSGRHGVDRARTEAIAAATSGAATVLSYNYRSLDADFTKAEALLTPAFRKSYEATTAKAVQPLAARYKAVSTAQVSAAGVVTASAGRATVLVFVSQQVTNTQLAAPRLDRSRIVVELVHQHGRWLIDKLTPV
jgi:Mce-associated membrane protein